MSAEGNKQLVLRWEDKRSNGSLAAGFPAARLAITAWVLLRVGIGPGLTRAARAADPVVWTVAA